MGFKSANNGSRFSTNQSFISACCICFGRLLNESLFANRNIGISLTETLFNNSDGNMCRCFLTVYKIILHRHHHRKNQLILAATWPRRRRSILYLRSNKSVYKDHLLMHHLNLSAIRYMAFFSAANILDKVVKFAILTMMARDDQNLTAPHQKCDCRLYYRF